MKKTISWAAFILYGLLIAYLSLSPATDEPMVINDKLAHFMAYGGFAFLGALLGFERRAYAITCVLIVAYSGLMEFGQSFVPGREMSTLGSSVAGDNDR